MAVLPLDPARAAAALREAGVEPSAVRSVIRLSGGVSNLTYRVDRDGPPRVVLRVQPPTGIFEPYDVLREARVLDVLASTAIPVPRVLGRAPAGPTLGAAYFVMEYVDAPHMGEAPRTPGLFARYLEMVAAIHALDWRAAGLGFLDPPAHVRDAVLRQIRSVTARAAARGYAGDPFLQRLHAALLADPPAGDTLVLCQGDINIFNYLVRDGRIVAVVDWEQAHIGDRRQDIGMFAALLALKAEAGTLPSAFPFVAAYGQQTGQALERLPYFVLAALYMLAVVHRIWSDTGESAPWWTRAELVRAAETMLAAPDF